MAEKEKRKRYSFSVVEEAVMNPDFKNFGGGRIEVFDNSDNSGYAFYEARFLIPIEFMDAFMEMWDGKESDEMPYIRWDCPGTRKWDNGKSENK